MTGARDKKLTSFQIKPYLTTTALFFFQMRRTSYSDEGGNRWHTVCKANGRPDDAKSIIATGVMTAGYTLRVSSITSGGVSHLSSRSTLSFAFVDGLFLVFVMRGCITLLQANCRLHSDTEVMIICTGCQPRLSATIMRLSTVMLRQGLHDDNFRGVLYNVEHSTSLLQSFLAESAAS